MSLIGLTGFRSSQEVGGRERRRRNPPQGFLPEQQSEGVLWIREGRLPCDNPCLEVPRGTLPQTMPHSYPLAGPNLG